MFEVLLAFAVMAMVLAAVLPRQSHLLGRVAQVDERQLAQDYALSRLDRLGVADALRAGVTVEDYRDWQVSLDQTETRLPDLPNAPMLRVVVTVESASGTSLARVETLRPLP